MQVRSIHTVINCDSTHLVLRQREDVNIVEKHPQRHRFHPAPLTHARWSSSSSALRCNNSIRNMYELTRLGNKVRTKLL